MLQQQHQFQQTGPLSGVSSIEDEPTIKGLVESTNNNNNGNFSSSDCDESIVSSPQEKEQQQQDFPIFI
ncbi:DUF1635 domain-containing protein, partial [Providencia rettgeri]